MNEEWRNELVTKGAAYDALNDVLIAYIPRLFGELEEIPIECAMAIIKMPSAQPKRIKGKWKRTKANSGYNAEWVCSNCGYTVYAEFCNLNFCSLCGADMRGDEDG